MITRREELEARERQTLAPYAMKSADSRGRVYKLEPSRDRTAFQRDHDRIIHSKAFRRMEYKTQVFVYSEGDHYRTRLTHSMEVAQVCRSISRILGINSDLSETVALAHDLGHPPFGHAGEKALDELLSSLGGFNHNEQTLRVVDYLERRYPNYPGLNLSYEVREGIARHESPGAKFDATEFPPGLGPTLEAAVVDLADEIAYNSHDVDDGLASSMFSLEDLNETPLCKRALEESRRSFPEIDDRLRRYHLVRTLVGWQIDDLTTNIDSLLTEKNIRCVEQVRENSREIVHFSHTMRKDLDHLRAFLRDNLYRRSRVTKMAERGKLIVRSLYNHFLKRPYELPETYGHRIDDEPVEFAVRDYVAGMTDRFAEQTFRSMSG